MIKKSIYLLVLLLVLMLQNATSQSSQVLYYMNLPQNHLVNPAFKPSSTFYLGIPALTGIDLTINNNFVNFSDVIMPGQKGDSLISVLNPDYNIDNFIKKLKTSNYIAPEISVQLLGLGFKAGKDLYVTLDVVDRVLTNFALPKDLFTLALKGNGDFIGKTINLSGLDAQLQYFHEFGMGFSKNFGNNLRIGVRGKLLFGVTNISLNNKSLGLKVNEEDYSFDFNADLKANISGPIKVYMNNKNTIDSVGFDENKFKKGTSDEIDINKMAGFLFNKKNMGLGIDIGAVYNITSKIQVSASITDIGFINWKSDITNLKAKSTFKFSGFNITDVINDNKTFDEIAQDMADSLKNSFSITNDNKPFKTSLPVGISVGGSFNLTKSISLGILSHSILSGKQVREALSLSANVNLGNSLSTSICYTAENGRFDNLGAGLAFRLGIFQIYFISDRIPIAWSRIKYETTETIPIPGGSREEKTPHQFILPKSWNTFNFRLGMNLSFGNKAKKKNDKPMLLEKK
jgi:hypothetical protein